MRVSSNLLPMIGARAERGRLFTADEDLEGAPATAILHHGTWQRRYGGDPSVVGRSVELNGQPYEIVGVMPAGFTLPREVLPTLGGAEEAEILLALPFGPKAPQTRNREDYNVLARLAPGVTARSTSSCAPRRRIRRCWYLVSQGTREIGIRMALGATPERVSGMVLRTGLSMAALGVATGLAGALLLTRFMQSLLFGIEATDPATFVAIVGLLAVMALVATWVPARRAARIDPLISLRGE